MARASKAEESMGALYEKPSIPALEALLRTDTDQVRSLANCLIDASRRAGMVLHARAGKLRMDTPRAERLA